jgi:hypothetical protein
VEYYAALQLSAMEAVVRPSRESFERYVCRWYSREFSTPLQEVLGIPLEEILQAYYEDNYEKMTEEDREAEIERLLETDQEREERAQQEEKADRAGDELALNLEKAIEQDMEQGKAVTRPLRRKKKEKLPGKLKSLDIPPKEETPGEDEKVIDMKFKSNLLKEKVDFTSEEFLSRDPLGATHREK